MSTKGRSTGMHKTLTISVCIIGAILVVSSIMLVKTYMSHANRWSTKSDTVKNTTYTSYGILSQNLLSSLNTPESINQQVNSITNMVDVHTPDIVCLQNTSSNFIDNIASYFKGNNFDIIIKYSDNTNQDSTPIFYNSKKYTLTKSGYFWLSDTPTMTSVAWTEAKPYIVTWAILKNKETCQTFGVANISLSKDTTIQSKSLQCIIDNCNSVFKGIEYTICGTYNCTTKDESFSMIDNKYSNLSVISNKLYNVGPTTTNATEDQSDDYVYDYFFGTKNVKCDRYAVLKDCITDTNGLVHYGVMSNIYFETKNDK